MRDRYASSHSDLHKWLRQQGFIQIQRDRTGFVFHRSDDDTCLITDTGIHGFKDYPYVDYTTNQNELMASYSRTFRFLIGEDTPPEAIIDEIVFFLNGESDPEKIKRRGRNRSEQEPDPTLPEAVFEDCFIEAFGDRARMALHREFPYADLDGVTRYVDYAIFSKVQKIAIELNGESFHHPAVIGPKRYRSQLFKQNSLISDGFKVYRWSLRGMRDRERFILELKRFLGPAHLFCDKPVLKLQRKIESFKLRRHQEDSLNWLMDARRQGRRNFLLVLPTATGKTEIFIEDIVRLKKVQPDLRALIIVPTRRLRKQTIARLKLRLPPQLKASVSDQLLSDTKADFFIQTSAWMQRHYYKIPADYFDYIVVDEAHHAPAAGLRSILQHFTPTHLLGVTATPDRTDQQSLEKIFGEYEPQLTLEDAIKQGLVPPVRCYRIKSNIDLSEVRFNGKEYVKSDLQKTLLVPSRDQLIVDVVQKYFGAEFRQKQGVIFCVDIKHAHRMADLLNKEGISASAVDGKNRKASARALRAYNDSSVRFLCACDLLSEGWDAPQTSILVMARPTFSKVLYTQQLGRGLRHYPGKEALYVIDVVDNYGARLGPMSLHALFKIPDYRPFENLINPERHREDSEIIILDGLFEHERRIEPVDILSFEEMYGNFLNEEQLARELFVSTGTVKQWIRKNKISSDVNYPFGRRLLHFFNPDNVENIRRQMKLERHTEETRVADFMQFIEKRDYTFSYKIIFMLAFLKIRNERFEASLSDLSNLYQRFYTGILQRYAKNERTKSPYNRRDYVTDEKKIQRSVLENPFEKFERKRFFYHCKDLNYIALDPVLAEKLTQDNFRVIAHQMIEDLKDYYQKIDIELSESDYVFLLQQSDDQSLFVDNPQEEQKFKSVLPLYSLDIAAGGFIDSDVPLEPETWFQVEGLSSRRTFSPAMFVAQVQGKSMEPDIPDGAWCLFSFEVGGSRNGRIVLAQQINFADPETGAAYTIKRYHSTIRQDPETGWKHESIILKPSNPEFSDIVIPEEDASDFKIIAFFLEVLYSED